MLTVSLQIRKILRKFLLFRRSLAEHDKVRFTKWNGEFVYVGLDFRGSNAKKVRIKRSY